jgi:predicted acyl esterase
MFGVSYFAWIQLFVAALNPPHLKCLFSPWAATDFYRDLFCRGGIPAPTWPIGWGQTSLTYANCRPENHSKKELGDEGYQDAIARLLADEDYRAIPEVVKVLKDPESGVHPFVVDLLLHPLYGRYWQERTVEFDKIRIPAYLGADWGGYGQHLPGALRAWEKLNVPKKLIIGPPIYLDRPLYQLQHEAVRWFDHWVKGKETGIMDEPPVRLFIMGTNEWKAASDWPVPETKWTPFYLHEGGLLSEHEYWPNEGFDSFDDSPWGRGYLEYSSPPLVENTEVTGPIALKLHASTTDTEMYWIVSLLEIDPGGNERILTKGWLRGSHRDLDLEQSRPWAPVHPHTASEPLTPGEVYDFDISLVATGNLFKAGSRIGLKISCADDEPKNPLELIACGNLKRQSVSRITVHHNAEYPSCLILPITRGNILGTYMSGGQFPGRS